jgi:hypothetical protein
VRLQCRFSSFLQIYLQLVLELPPHRNRHVPTAKETSKPRRRKIAVILPWWCSTLIGQVYDVFSRLSLEIGLFFFKTQIIIFTQICRYSFFSLGSQFWDTCIFSKFRHKKLENIFTQDLIESIFTYYGRTTIKYKYVIEIHVFICLFIYFIFMFTWFLHLS